MSQGKRPGGLTALAVINFVFGGFGCLGIFGMVALMDAANTITEGAAGTEVASSGMLMVSIILMVATVALLIISGVGYLGLKKTLGFKMGNLYAIASILSSVLGIVVAGFAISSVIGFIYPAVTLVLLNTTFKKDFVN